MWERQGPMTVALGLVKPWPSQALAHLFLSDGEGAWRRGLGCHGRASPALGTPVGWGHRPTCVEGRSPTCRDGVPGCRGCMIFALQLFSLGFLSLSLTYKIAFKLKSLFSGLR